MNNRKITHYISYIFVLTTLFGKAQVKAQTIAAEIPVSYDVSQTGAFQYSLPIRIPPGIKDMVPNLAITYNSQSGDGILGIGWSLSGLSAITRGVPTIFHNRLINPVDFYPDDVFILDGQRLFWEASSGRYHTEVKNFAKIKPYGTAGYGPSYFIVEYPNGLTFEYGNSYTSKMFAQGKPDVLTWAVNKISDKNGNYIEFGYVNNPNTGEYKIKTITYGENSVSVTGNQLYLDLRYTARSDNNKQWLEGSEIISNEVLEDVYVYHTDGSEANHYHFTYDVNIRTRLTQIEETRNMTTSLPPVIVNWGDAEQDNLVTLNTNLGQGFTGITGDFNGDGFTDYIQLSNSTGLYYRFLNDKNNGFTPLGNGWAPIPASSSAPVPVLAPPRNKMIFDYDGDGMDDVIIINYDNSQSNISSYDIYLLRANGTTSGANVMFDPAVLIRHGYSTSNYHATFNQNLRITAGDFDGDGKTELIVAQPISWNNTNSIGSYAVELVGHEYVPMPVLPFTSVAIHNFLSGHIDGIMTLDFDGDGKDEYLFTRNLGGGSSKSHLFSLTTEYNSITGKPSLVYDPNGYAVSSRGTNDFPNSYLLNWPGDYNGDGKTDILAWYPNANVWLFAYSDGTNDPYKSAALIPPTSPLSNLLSTNVHISSQAGHYSIHTGDFNADGLEDILELRDPVGTGYSNSSNYKIFYSTGESFTIESGSIGISATHSSSNIGDFNGDGEIDIFSEQLLSSNSPITLYQDRLAFLKPNDNRLKVTSIEHAGKTVEADYTTIAQDVDYTQLSNFGHPYIHRTFPIKVVKTLHDNATTYNTYKYRGAAFHKYGLGFRGFEETTFENINGKKIHNKYTLNTQVPYLSESIVFDAIDANQPFGTKTVNHQFTTNGGANGSSRIIVQDAVITEDYINGQAAEKYFTAGNSAPGSVFHEFGQYESIETFRKDLTGATTGHEIINYTYDPSGIFINRAKPISITSFSEIGNTGNGITRTTDYVYFNTTGQLATMITDPSTSNQTSTSYLYTAHGHLSKTTLTATGITGSIVNEYSYTPDARFVASEKNPELYVTTYEYDDLVSTWANLIKKTEPDGRETFYEYDDLNRIWKVTDYRGVETTTTYDWASSSSHSTTNVYEQFAVKTETTNILGSNTTIYDLYGRKIRETSPMFDGSDNVYTDYEYTHDGLLQTVTGPYPSSNISLGDMTSYLYDPFNRVVNVNSNTGATSTVYIYIGGILHTDVTPPNNITKTYLKWGDKPYKIFNNTENIEYRYYGNGTPKSINANGEVTTFTADAYGRMTKKVEPNAGATEYFYDALGRVVKEKLPNLIEYEYKFDKLGRVIDKKQVNQPNSYTYIYEPANTTPKAGRLTLTTAPNGSSVTYDYDSQGELIEMQESDGTNTFTTNYTYDGFGRKATHMYPAGDEITYSYNTYGFLNKVSLTNSPSGLPAQDLWTINSRNHLGQLTNAQYGVNSTTGLYQAVRTYDMYGFPTARMVDNNLLSTTISDMRYNFNQTTGNLSQRRDALRNLEENFTYDNDYERLTRVQYNLNIWVPPLPDLMMEYDNLGNILKKNDVTNSTYDWKYDTYALTLVPEPNTTIGTPFQPFEIPQNNTQDVEYYPFLKVKKVAELQKNEVHFTYGPDNERIKAEYKDIVTGTPVDIKTKYYANNYERIVDAGNGDVTHISYIWGGGEPIAILYQTTGTTPTSAIYYTVTDYLGSITHLLDNQGVTNGGIAEERSFDAWGRIRKPATWEPEYFSNPMNWKIDRGYTGHEHIWASLSWGAVTHNNNIINMNGRLYDALVGRMFSPDPVVTDNANSQDYNKYSYARNNPLKYTDPSGYTPISGTYAVSQPSNQHWTYYAGVVLMMAAPAVGQGVASFAGGAVTGGVSGFVSGVGSSMYSGNTRLSTIAGGGLKGGVSGALMGGIIGGFQGSSGKGSTSELKGGKAPGSRSTQLAEAANYNGSPEQIANDQQLNIEMNAEFDMTQPSLSAQTITTAAPPNYGMTKDRIYVNPKGYLVYAATPHTPMGFNDYHISPYALKFAGTSNHHIFRAIAGHELVHGYHWTMFAAPQGARGALNYWNSVGQNYSEVAAWNYSYNVYIQAGDYIHAAEASQQIKNYSIGGVNSQFLFNVPIFR